MTGDVPQNLVACPSFGRDQWPALEDIAAEPRRAAIVLESRIERLLFARADFERLAASVSARTVSARASACALFKRLMAIFQHLSSLERL